MNDRFLRLSEAGILFDPSQISGLQHWIDVTDLSTVQTDTSGNVPLVTDKSGNARNMTASGGTIPAMSFNDADNGLPALVMNINTAIKATFTGITLPFTIYIYVKQNGISNGAQIVDFGAGFTGGLVQKTGGSVNALDLVLGSNWVPHQPPFYKANKWCLYCFSVDAAGVVTCAIDNGPMVQYGSAGTTSPTQVQLGGGIVTGNNQFSVQEMFIFNSQVSRAQHIEICHYFFNKYYTKFVGSYTAFGDSITLGANASNIGVNNYVALIQANKGWDTYNQGFSGGSIGYATGLGGIMLSGQYRNYIIGTNRSPYITFAYGTNDSTIDANWKQMYKRMIQYFITLGCDPNRLCIVSPLSNTAKVLYPQIAIYCGEIASELGIKYADCYSAGLAGGGDALISGDHIHPNDAGHALMATTIEAVLN